MNRDRAWLGVNLAALAALVLGIVGCAIGAAIDSAGFCRAWLCAYLFWLGLPLAGVTLVLVHDLSGGAWMATARSALDAAIATMPLATLAGIAAFVGLHALYGWTQPASELTNAWYLNPADFLIRYGTDIVLWNLLAAFALWAPRGRAAPIAPGLSWLSGVGLVLLALSASFAAIDWILSLEPRFWSSIFPMAIGAGWFNTGLAVVLLAIAVTPWPAGERRAHMADLAAILLATTIFWMYAEFIQYLIVWEENLKSEIAWYLPRLVTGWRPALYVSIGLGFVVPFFVLLWAPTKRNRTAVTIVCGLMLLGRLADKWWLALPQFHPAPPFWLDTAAVLALGGAMMLAFAWAYRCGDRLRLRTWRAAHG